MLPSTAGWVATVSSCWRRENSTKFLRFYCLLVFIWNWWDFYHFNTSLHPFIIPLFPSLCLFFDSLPAPTCFQHSWVYIHTVLYYIYYAIYIQFYTTIHNILYIILCIFYFLYWTINAVLCTTYSILYLIYSTYVYTSTLAVNNLNSEFKVFSSILITIDVSFWRHQNCCEHMKLYKKPQWCQIIQTQFTLKLFKLAI